MSAPMSEQRLAEILARADAATTGPWKTTRVDVTRLVESEDCTFQASFGYVGNRTEAEAEFVAAARTDVPELVAEVTRLRAQLTELTYRARRVAISHERFIQDHSDPGTEALAAQYELINWLSTSEYHEGLPANPIENALRIVLAELDKYDENVTPGELRAAIAEALPREDMSDRRRRVYVDGHGDGWIDQSTDSDGTRWLVQLSSMAAGGSEPKSAVAERTGSLREIGRCW